LTGFYFCEIVNISAKCINSRKSMFFGGGDFGFLSVFLSDTATSFGIFALFCHIN